MSRETQKISKSSLKSKMSQVNPGSKATVDGVSSKKSTVDQIAGELHQSRAFVTFAEKIKVTDIRELLNMDQLHMLKAKFDVALDNVMTHDEFKEALKEVSGKDFYDEDFDILFLKINEKCNGVVTWDEYVSYLLLSYKAKDMIDNIYEPRFLVAPISRRPKVVKSRHPHAISGLCFATNIDQGSVGYPLQGAYYTVSSEGVVNRWTVDMDFVKTNMADCTGKNEKVPIECLTAESLPDVNILAIATSNRELHFYDTTAGGLTAKVVITHWDHNVNTMYFFSRKLLQLYRSFRVHTISIPTIPDDTQCILLIGDVGGNIYILSFSSFNCGPFQRRMGTMLIKISYKAVAKGKLDGMSVIELQNHHPGPVRQLYYHHGLNSILSCSNTPKRSMVICRINDKTSNVYYGEEPIMCFSMDDVLQTLAGGTTGGFIYVWNLFVPNKRTTVFKGHNQAIIKVVLQNKSTRLYSLDVHRIIKIWNIRNLECLQTFNKIPSTLGERTVLCTHYNSGTRALVLASLQVVVLECDRKPLELHTHGTTHSKPVSVVLYNNLFKSVVTCGCDSIIICWDLKTGVKQVVIMDAHTRVIQDEEFPMEITAATFHTEYHLLLTGANDGTIKMWNFNTGFCMKTMSIGNAIEVTYLLWINNRILVGSWNSCIAEFDDSSLNSGAKAKMWDRRHAEHISNADHRQGLVMVTVSYGGEMVMWNMDTSSPKRQYLLSNPRERVDIGSSKKGKGFKEGTKTVPRLSTEGVSESNMPKIIQPNTAQDVIFLVTRPINAETGNFLISLGDGTIQVWSEHPAGGYLTSFIAVHTVGDYVTTMITDKDNCYLITGTACGYIKIWLLTNYYTSNKEHVCMPKLRLQFPFLWKDRVEGRAKRFCRKQPLPLLLSSYRAHLKAISSIVYIPENDYILTGSADCSVRIWSLSGQYLNTLGCYITPWEVEAKTPPDVHKVASSTTLKVWNHGEVSRFVPKFGDNKTLITPSETSLLDQIADKIPSIEFLRKICRLPQHPPAVPKLILDDSMPKIPVYTYLNIPEVGPLPVLSKTPACMVRIKKRKDIIETKEKKGIHFAD